MTKKQWIALAALVVIALAAGGWYVWERSRVAPASVGGERDAQGCLIAGGYRFDEAVGACARSFELTPDIAQAARMAVEVVGPSYSLTVVSFNSYEERGAYDITLERGSEHTQETVSIRNWQVQR